MPNYCRCDVIGHLCRDVELKHLPNGSVVGTTSIAYTEKVKDKEYTTFLELTFWGKTAEVAAEYCSKGKAVLVTGRLRQENWEDKQTGGKRSKIGMQVDKLVMLGDSKGKTEPETAVKRSQSYSESIDDGDTPF
jgi:single-strand DNA-binding protein